MMRLLLAIATAIVLTLVGSATAETINGDASRCKVMDVQHAVGKVNSSVTLNLEDVELSNVLRLLSDTNRVNIIAGPDVQGSVSVNLYDIPFEDALGAILGVSGFTYFWKGDIIYVTSETSRGNLPMGSNDMVTMVARIHHADPAGIMETVTELLSPSGKAILSVDKNIIVQDSPEYVDAIIAMVEELDTPPRQVLITAKILTVTHNDEETLGVEFHEEMVDLPGLLTTGFAADLRYLPGAARGLFAGTTSHGIEGLLDALAEKSEIDIIASPQLLVLDGETADIQVGDRLGFRVTTVTDTASLESVEFLEVGTQLEVTPHITDDGLVRLEVHPKVSNGSISVDGLPSENTTEATTKMLVQDGQTALIGGLLNITKQRSRSQVPLLGDIPLIGLAFGRNRWRDTKTEVIILITPSVVETETSPDWSPNSTNANRWMSKRTEIVESRQRDIIKGSRMVELNESFAEKLGRTENDVDLKPIFPPGEARSGNGMPE